MSSHKNVVCALSFLFAALANAQTPPPAPPAAPDVLVLKNGEKVIGQLQNATSSAVTFKSDGFGEITVDWSKVAELKTSQRFAAIPAGVRIKDSSDQTKVPVGTVSASDKDVELSPAAAPAPAQTLPVSSISNLIQEQAFQKALEPKNFFRGWDGGVTIGVLVTQATQNSQSYSGSLNLTRIVPNETWLDQRSRTAININQAYGEVNEPGTPTIKTSLVHGDIGESWYLSPRFFILASAAFDHSYSQGLDLQQNYGGGIGFVLIKSALQELDVTATVNYIDQRFADSSLDQNLIGSSFGESYIRKLPRKIVLTEAGTFTPAWNNTNAYSAVGNASLTFPVYHRLGFSFAALDNFINNPPPGFKKNSFQVSVGATYAFR
ncbi:MAG TPA: DUF481 domain-containing protein [Bryobacteraceae bacterium]|nr:DUF481 domain-containing protein [Bryobacteraceae bacterium]